MAVYNSGEVRSVDITWGERQKIITVHLENGEKYCIKSEEGTKCTGPDSNKQ